MCVCVCEFFFILFLFILAQQPPVGHDLLILAFSRSHTTTHHNRQDSSGRVISSSHRPLPDNTQHSRQTDMPPVGFQPTISAGQRPQTDAFDGAATGTSLFIVTDYKTHIYINIMTLFIALVLSLLDGKLEVTKRCVY